MTEHIEDSRQREMQADGMDTSVGVTVVFDTDCVLCSHWVKFILRHEASDGIQFASSRKSNGNRLAAQFGFRPEDLDLTYLVIRHGRALTKSDATLALLGELKAPWSWLRIARLIPRPVRNGLYDVVARNRLRWFGEEKDCFLPSADQRHRFLD
ncbi:MAG: DCC1-like thiol-disulfide oxidoreductase family protein [Pseudomonadota bacterium]